MKYNLSGSLSECPFYHGVNGQSVSMRTESPFGKGAKSGHIYYANCQVCGARGPERSSYGAAKEAWNARAIWTDRKKSDETSL